MNLRIVRRVPGQERCAASRSRCTRCSGASTRHAACARRQELDTSLDRLLPVGTLEGLPEAVDLLLRHRTGRVTIIGDFDADGATSSALMVRALRGCGFADVDFLVPNRFEFGYGLTPEIVALAPSARPPSSSPWTTASRATPAWPRRARAGSMC